MREFILRSLLRGAALGQEGSERDAAVAAILAAEIETCR
jgi:hypothetical protein